MEPSLLVVVGSIDAVPSVTGLYVESVGLGVAGVHANGEEELVPTHGRYQSIIAARLGLCLEGPRLNCLQWVTKFILICFHLLNVFLRQGHTFIRD